MKTTREIRAFFFHVYAPHGKKYEFFDAKTISIFDVLKKKYH